MAYINIKYVKLAEVTKPTQGRTVTITQAQNLTSSQATLSLQTINFVG